MKHTTLQGMNIERDNLSLMKSGKWMNGFADGIAPALSRCEDLCFKLNSLPPSRLVERRKTVKEIIGSIGSNFVIHSPFHCDFGKNIHIGENFIGNFNLTILDEAEVTIGDNVFIGPNSSLCTVIHAFDAEQRNAGIMRAVPIVIEDNVWIAANVVVLPGVTIGAGSIIGAGSVVVKDIPRNVMAVGNPCKVVRAICESDKIDTTTISYTV